MASPIRANPLCKHLAGEKVSIVSWKPQTTRNRIFGIYNDEVTQIVFIDTPTAHPKEQTWRIYDESGKQVAGRRRRRLIFD